jgi:hypothetical protein
VCPGIFCTTMHRCILQALSPSFLAKRVIPVLSHPPYSPYLAPADFFLFPKLKIAKKWTRFEAVLSIQQTLRRELKATQEETFSRAFDSLYERCVQKRAGTILSDGINKHFLSFYLVSYCFFGNLIVTSCIQVYVTWTA